MRGERKRQEFGVFPANSQRNQRSVSQRGKGDNLGEGRGGGGSRIMTKPQSRGERNLGKEKRRVREE